MGKMENGGWRVDRGRENGRWTMENGRGEGEGEQGGTGAEVLSGAKEQEQGSGGAGKRGRGEVHFCFWSGDRI